MTTSVSKKIMIIEMVSTDLMLRFRADNFFDDIESFPDKKIVIDFSGVESISRSFAHQYMLRKNKTPKKIEEINIPSNVEKMLDIVQNSTVRSPSFEGIKFRRIEAIA